MREGGQARDAAPAGDGFAVAHRIERYLGSTETFIYDTLVSLRRTRPIVIASRFENLERFPLAKPAILKLSPPPRGTAAWAVSALARRLPGGRTHLEHLLRRERARLIHAHFGPAACDMVETARRTGLPLVASFYGYDASVGSVLEEFGARYRGLFEMGTAILVEGPIMARRLESIGCPPVKIRLQRIGIDLNRYRFHERAPAAGRPVRLLQCARMIPKKGFETTLKSLALARRGGSRVELRLIGDGPLMPQLAELARELGLEGAVTFLGSQPREAFIRELDEADLYVQPSRTAEDGDTEGGAPTTILEAQASGLPILATRHADIPHIVREGESALLSEEADAPGLAANISRLAADPALWARMGRAGRAHVEAAHDARRLAHELESFYEERCAPSGGTRGAF
ncbi:MAG TPA: glycosyltransferase [Candidatus Polarisedimenticolia bacterium]|nr:glycosyltransferase [Candidatus Polarisedimenticolia bacterium]